MTKITGKRRGTQVLQPKVKERKISVTTKVPKRLSTSTQALTPKEAGTPKKKGLFDAIKWRIFSALKPMPKVENVSPADKLFDKADLEEKALKAMDFHKLARIKDLEKAEKAGKPIHDFAPKSQIPKDVETITAEELPNPDDAFEEKIKAAEERQRRKAEAESEGEADPMEGGDIFTSPDTSE